MTRGAPGDASGSARMPVLLLALLVAVRVAMVAAQPLLAARVPEWAWSNNDGYERIAVHWVETGVYSMEPGVPTALRLPLYPALIAGAHLVAGAAAPGLVMGAQAALSIWTGGLLFGLTAGLFGRRSAVWAVLLFLFHPQVNLFVVRCATETSYVFLLAAWAHEAVLFLRTRRARPLVLAAAAMGLSLLTRPTLLPLAGLALMALLVWSFRDRGAWRRRLGWTALAAGTVGLLLAPWLVRNRIRSGGDWVLQTWTGQPLCQGAYVSRHLDEFFSGRRSLTDLDQACLAEIQVLEKRFLRTTSPEARGIAREIASDRYFRQRARLLAMRSPMDRAKGTLRNLLWTPVLQMTWGSTRVLMLLHWPLLAFGLWGMAACARTRPHAFAEASPVWMLFGYLLLAHAAAWPQARYVLPGLVPFMGFCAFGMVRCFSAMEAWAQTRRRRRPGSI